jgi:pimeloyl-ACP methyl ester carboxylesterase
LASTVDAFTEALKIDRYAIYVFDYGAPTGLRLAMAHPERVTAIISQNGNAYEEGLGTLGIRSENIGHRRQPQIAKYSDKTF